MGEASEKGYQARRGVDVFAMFGGLVKVQNSKSAIKEAIL